MVRQTKKQDRNPENLIPKERGTEVKIKDEQHNIMKRQCRFLIISAEHNTSVRITDEVSLLNWISRFAVKLLNKLRIDRRWTKPMVQSGKKIWFQRIGEEGINSMLKRRIQGTFVERLSVGDSTFCLRRANRNDYLGERSQEGNMQGQGR